MIKQLFCWHDYREHQELDFTYCRKCGHEPGTTWWIVLGFMGIARA